MKDKEYKEEEYKEEEVEAYLLGKSEIKFIRISNIKNTLSWV